MEEEECNVKKGGYNPTWVPDRNKNSDGSHYPVIIIP